MWRKLWTCAPPPEAGAKFSPEKYGTFQSAKLSSGLVLLPPANEGAGRQYFQSGHKVYLLRLRLSFCSRGGVCQTPSPLEQADTPQTRQTPPPPAERDGHCSRRYASYWNAFLLILVLLLELHIWIYARLNVVLFSKVWSDYIVKRSVVLLSLR